MSPQRVIRPAARRSPAGAGSLLWTAAAAALPVIVTVLVLVVLSLGALLFSATGFDSLVAVVAVEWLVVNRVPLTVDTVGLGFLPLLPPLIYVAVLARQTRAVLADVEQPGAPEAGAAIAGATVTGMLLTGLASLLMGSAASDFAVRESSLPVALLWTAAVGLVGSGLGVWLFFRRALRERLPMWVRGGIHLGVAFVAATWAIAAFMVLTGILFAWEPIGASLEIGKGFVGTAALTGISVAYLPNVVMAGAALLVGGEAHLGEASYSVFAVSRGPMPEVPLAAALPTTSPHWVVQGLLLVTVLVAAGLARYVAHWFRTTADAVKATWLAAAIVALVTAISPVVAGGQLGVLGQVGTGWVIASVMALLLFGIIGSATIALSLAGLTRRRERAEDELLRRRRRAGTSPEWSGADTDGFEGDPEDEHRDGDEGDAVPVDDVGGVGVLDDPEFDDPEFGDAEFGDAEFDDAEPDDGALDDDDFDAAEFDDDDTGGFEPDPEGEAEPVDSAPAESGFDEALPGNADTGDSASEEARHDEVGPDAQPADDAKSQEADRADGGAEERPDDASSDLPDEHRGAGD